MFEGLVDFALDRWRHDCDARRVWFTSRPGPPLQEGRFVLGTFRSERMRVPYRSRQDDRLRVMLALVHIDITPPQDLDSDCKKFTYIRGFPKLFPPNTLHTLAYMGNGGFRDRFA
ncbi:hypothetical protein TNCV_1992531 [Trichonephila clavipes]|nr:hypothetical protein TNCV_1992531 [Trichonephila clavipes]